jgi:hypothetical protein
MRTRRNSVECGHDHIANRNDEGSLRFGSRLRSLFLLLLFLQARVAPSREFALELLNPASRINIFQFAREKWVTLIANVNSQFRASAAGYKRISAATSYLRFLVFGVDTVLHRR